jgi:hypothetical protein
VEKIRILFPEVRIPFSNPPTQGKLSTDFRSTAMAESKGGKQAVRAKRAKRELGDIASALLFENERVRIWEMRLDAGEEGPIHQHSLDHVLIQISGDRMAVVPEPDTASMYNEYMEAEVFPGNYFFVEKGGIERARNVGAQPFHEIIVELKD